MWPHQRDPLVAGIAPADVWECPQLVWADGVPVLVEVKQASDTRARREVVAQMLDYAANGVAFWPVENLLASFQRTCEQQGLDADQQLAAFLGDAAELLTVSSRWVAAGREVHMVHVIAPEEIDPPRPIGLRQTAPGSGAQRRRSERWAQMTQTRASGSTPASAISSKIVA